MTNNNYNLDSSDEKILKAMHSKGWVIPTDGSDIDCNDVPPLPKEFEDSIAAANKIIAMAKSQEERPAIISFAGSNPNLESEDLKQYSMAARKGERLSSDTESKLSNARSEILKRRANKKE